MRYLILGAEGQLGRAFRELLAAQGHEVAALGRAGADVTDFQALRGAFASVRPEVVINCAAYNLVDRA
ncbi:MAG: sugar nucleotide-binding protein, partial [Firmicutes bacterium]|nr:sugar nucleotide-binding protein [Bacillota bacterium]